MLLLLTVASHFILYIAGKQRESSLCSLLSGQDFLGGGKQCRIFITSLLGIVRFNEFGSHNYRVYSDIFPQCHWASFIKIL